MTPKLMFNLLALLFLLPLPIIEICKYVYSQLASSYAWYEIAVICNPHIEDIPNLSAKFTTLFVACGLIFVVGWIVASWYEHYREKEK